MHSYYVILMFMKQPVVLFSAESLYANRLRISSPNVMDEHDSQSINKLHNPGI